MAEVNLHSLLLSPEELGAAYIEAGGLKPPTQIGFWKIHSKLVAGKQVLKLWKLMEEPCTEHTRDPSERWRCWKCRMEVKKLLEIINAKD